MRDKKINKSKNMENQIVINEKLKFKVRNDLEKYRVESIFEKEPETIAWIQSFANTKERTIFFDIGANIGIYSCYAASLSSNVDVFSFEPVSNNFSSILENSLINEFTNLSCFNIALSDHNSLSKIYLSDLRIGNSGAQLDSPINEYGASYNPVKIDQVFGFSLDFLVENVKLEIPNFIKIDVDGQEDKILLGMKGVLEHPSLHSLLVEFNSNEQFLRWEKIFSKCGLNIDTRLDNLPNHSRKRRIEKGNLARNYIFSR